MELIDDFNSFLEGIRPTDSQRDDLQKGHTTLRERLLKDPTIKQIHISDLLQGSYRRATAVRPRNDERSDVDIVIVTNLSENEYSPKAAMNVFKPFLETYYKGKWRQQSRSFGIELTYVDLDLVITSAPAEAQIGILKSDAVVSDDDIIVARDWRLNPSWLALDKRYGRNVKEVLLAAEKSAEWKLEPLRIPDRTLDIWEDTHPLEQIRWTRDKNAITGGHFVNVVKAMKWWRLVNYDKPEHLKGYPLERLVGECCPDDIVSVADGVTRTLEGIASEYETLVSNAQKPVFSDYGVPSHDVFKRITADEFKEFYAQVKEGAALARSAFDSQDREESGLLWQKLFGNKFPNPPSKGTKGRGFTPPTGPAVPGSERFA